MELLKNLSQDPLTGCWNWQGRRDRNGYGYLTFRGKTKFAHRVSFHLFKGFDLDSHLFVCHKCDNPACINPEHLFPGTNRDNILDSLKKGRHFNASRTHCSKGHEYTPDNTLIVKGSERVCRTCKRDYERPRARAKYWEKKCPNL